MDTYPTYLHSWISFSLIVSRGLFSLICINRIHAEYPAINNTVNHFHRHKEKKHQQQEFFHDAFFAHAALWYTRAK